MQSITISGDKSVNQLIYIFSSQVLSPLKADVANHMQYTCYSQTSNETENKIKG